MHKVRSCLLGVRESFGEVVFDPVLPFRLDGLRAEVRLCGRPVQLTYAVRHRTHAPEAITVNGAALDVSRRDSNPYRRGGVRVDREILLSLLSHARNRIEIVL